MIRPKNWCQISCLKSPVRFVSPLSLLEFFATFGEEKDNYEKNPLIIILISYIKIVLFKKDSFSNDPLLHQMWRRILTKKEEIQNVQGTSNKISGTNSSARSSSSPLIIVILVYLYNIYFIHIILQFKIKQYIQVIALYNGERE